MEESRPFRPEWTDLEGTPQCRYKIPPYQTSTRRPTFIRNRNQNKRKGRSHEMVFHGRWKSGGWGLGVPYRSSKKPCLSSGCGVRVESEQRCDYFGTLWWWYMWDGGWVCQHGSYGLSVFSLTSTHPHQQPQQPQQNQNQYPQQNQNQTISDGVT